MAPALTRNMDEGSKHPEWGDNIDPSAFEQILEMDDEEDKDFSRGIVYGFFDQAESTFKTMEKALSDRDLDKLSQLGHFLKGSSATLGLIKVKDACEKIQHLGAGKDETGTVDEPDKTTSLGSIKQTLKTVKKDFGEVQTVLEKFYREDL